jgi:probable HAF family extracellular repeat protein
MRRRGSGAKFLIAASFTAFLWAGITAGPSVIAAKNLTDMGYTLTDMGTLGGFNSVPVASNEKGQVIGWSHTTGNLTFHTFLYSDGKMTELTQVVSDLFLVDSFQSFEILRSGQIIGGGSTGGLPRFHFDGTKIIACHLIQLVRATFMIEE